MKTKKNMNLQPLSDRVIVERAEAQERTEGGILLPSEARLRPHEGVVMAVGPGRRLENGGWETVKVKVGDTVLFPQYAGTQVDVNGHEYLILPEADILAVKGVE